jgi:hypothetical protein
MLKKYVGKKELCLMEKINNNLDIIDTFSKIPYNKRIKNTKYNELVIETDKLATELKTKFE